MRTVAAVKTVAGVVKRRPGRPPGPGPEKWAKEIAPIRAQRVLEYGEDLNASFDEIEHALDRGDESALRLAIHRGREWLRKGAVEFGYPHLQAEPAG